MNIELFTIIYLFIVLFLGSICNLNRSFYEKLDFVDYMIGYLIASFWPAILFAAFYVFVFNGSSNRKS